MISQRTEKEGIASRTGKLVDKKIIVIGGAMALSILIMVVMFRLETRLSSQSKSYSSVASAQQVISQQIVVNAFEAVAGNLEAFDTLATNQNRYLETLRKLDEATNSQSMALLSSDFSIEYAILKDIWSDYSKNISTVAAARKPIGAMSLSVARIKESLPELVSLSKDVVAVLVRRKAPQSNIALAASQLVLLGAIENSLNQIVSDGKVVMVAANRFLGDTQLIEKQLIAMLEGDSSSGIKRFTGKVEVARLVQFADLFSVVKRNVKEVLDNSPILFKVHQASLELQSLSPSILAASTGLLVKIATWDAQLQFLTISGYVFGVLGLIFMILLTLILVRGSLQRLAEAQNQNEKNQRAILRLLDEMTNLADGDLSTHTTVTEDITGAIADSVNYSIDALRDLVGTINKTAVQVSSAVRKTQSTTSHLEQESASQAKEIIGVSSTITEISQSMSSVSAKATDSAEVARKSVSIAHQGGEAVRQAIVGMETIRGQIQETSKRIKRLGESSQEIGDIVSLITEISDQTNILALNAAIQASMAGEAGRGFAVVADEVQRLAERTGDATKQIEALVKTIQADTNEATASMEQSTSNVVKGAQLTENAGSALDKIEQVSMNLAQRILEISDATKSQAVESVKITQTMDVIQQITMKTSIESGQASSSIGELSDMVKAMHKSVAGFKLPGLGTTDSSVLDLAGFSVKGISK